MKILRNKSKLAAVYMLIFAVLIILMTVSGGTDQAMFERTAIDICIFDEDDTAASHALCDLIAERNNIVTLENDRDVILDALYYDRVSYVLTIKQGFSEKLASGETEDLLESSRISESFSNVCMSTFINEYVSAASAYIKLGYDVSEACTRAAAALAKEADVTVSAKDDSSAVFSADAAFYFRYLPYVLILTVMSSLCPVLLAMNRKEIRLRTDCSVIRNSSYTMQIFAGSVVYILAVWLIFMAGGVMMNGGLYSGREWLAVINSFVFTVFTASFTILVSSFISNPKLINIISVVIGITSSFLSGVFVDQSLLGEGVLSAARFIPMFWYIKVNRMLEGTELYDMNGAAAAIMIEIAFTAAAAILAMLIRKEKGSSAFRRA